LISDKKADSKGQCDEIAERGSEVEKKDGDPEDGHGRLQPLRMEKGREGFPDLIENDWDGKKKAAIQGQFEQGEEASGMPKATRFS